MACRALRRITGNLDADRIIDRIQIALLDAVAFASLQETAGSIHAKIADDVFGPSQALGGLFEAILGREYAVAAARRFLAQKVGFLTKQPEAVFHFPCNMKIGCARRLLRERSIERRKQSQDDEDECKAHGYVPVFNIQVAAEI